MIKELLVESKPSIDSEIRYSWIRPLLKTRCILFSKEIGASRFYSIIGEDSDLIRIKNRLISRSRYYYGQGAPDAELPIFIYPNGKLTDSVEVIEETLDNTMREER